MRYIISDKVQYSITASTTSNQARSKGLDAGKKKVISPITGLEWPRGFRKLRIPDYMTTAQDGGKVVSRRHRQPLPPGNAPDTHFC